VVAVGGPGRVGIIFTDATFQTPLLLNSGNNPAANANGQVQVLPGDRIPGIPRHRANLVLDYSMTDRFSVGGSAVAQSNVYRFGDQANLTQPVGGRAYCQPRNAHHRLWRRAADLLGILTPRSATVRRALGAHQVGANAYVRLRSLTIAGTSKIPVVFARYVDASRSKSEGLHPCMTSGAHAP
jgi:hypothetical protein